MSAKETKKIDKVIMGELQDGGKKKSLYVKSMDRYQRMLDKQYPASEMSEFAEPPVANVPTSSVVNMSASPAADIPDFDYYSEPYAGPEKSYLPTGNIKKMKTIVEEIEEFTGEDEPPANKPDSVYSNFTLSDKSDESVDPVLLVSKKPTRRTVNAALAGIPIQSTKATMSSPPTAKKWFPTTSCGDTTRSPIEIEKLDESTKEIVNNLRSDLLISCHTKRSTYVVAYARNIIDPMKNQLLNIYANGNKAIGGSLYDYNSDCFVVNGCDVFEIGTFPFALTASMKMISSWSIPLPLSEQVILSNMTPISRKRYDDWKNRFPENEYTIEFLQNAL